MRSTPAGAAPMSKTACATTGCSNSASAATGPISPRVPALPMNDDREVTCYALLTEQLAARDGGKALPGPFKRRALEAWIAQRDLDDGCHQLASTLVEARLFTPDDVWLKARYAAEANRPRAARAAAALAAPQLQAQVAAALDNPALYLNAGATVTTRAHAEVTTLALIRVAASDPEVAADATARTLATATAQGSVGLGLGPDRTQCGAEAGPRGGGALPHRLGRGRERQPVAGLERRHAGLGRARRACAASTGAERWRSVQRAIDHMSDAEQTRPRLALLACACASARTRPREPPATRNGCRRRPHCSSWRASCTSTASWRPTTSGRR